ncbi:unnamed protein product [Owenia fusiformis]|uniref:VWFA domain-containing protein n=1 Tax=Owenia fusiformis TaxID=6347 RepID=A0A8S4PX20_OWEFU|nr:unnamed protein product [Owenia fusiformis]
MNAVYLRVVTLMLTCSVGIVFSQGKQSVCADIVFAIETSCSVDDETKALAKLFIKDFVAQFDSVKEGNVSNVATQFGMIAYDVEARHVFTFNEKLSKLEILNKIENFQMETIDCKTHTQNAINMAKTDFFESDANDNRSPDALFVITDGRTQPQKFIPETTSAIRELRKTVRTIAIELPNKKGRELLPDTQEQLETLADDADRFQLDNETDTEELASTVFDHFLSISEFVCPPEDPVHPCHAKCQYTPPPPKTEQPGLRRYKRVNAILDCTYEDDCDIQFLKDFAAELDRQPKCKMYYPLKAVAENRLYVVYGCDSAGHLEKALLTKDSRFKCHVQPVMDYYDFAILTLGLEMSRDNLEAIMPRASLKCETLVAVFRELSYPPGKTYDEIMSAWRAHAMISFLQKGTPEGGNREVFHYVGEEREVVFRVWDNPEQLDYNVISGGWVLQKNVTSGISHRSRTLIHLDCICNPDRDMYR